MLSSRHTLPIASRLAFAFSLFLLPFAPPYQGPGSRCSEEAAPLRSTITIMPPPTPPPSSSAQWCDGDRLLRAGKTHPPPLRSKDDFKALPPKAIS